MSVLRLCKDQDLSFLKQVPLAREPSYTAAAVLNKVVFSHPIIWRKIDKLLQPYCSVYTVFNNSTFCLVDITLGLSAHLHSFKDCMVMHNQDFHFVLSGLHNDSYVLR